MTYNLVLVSGVQQSDPALYIHTHIYTMHTFIYTKEHIYTCVCVCIELDHFAVLLKLTQDCKSSILRLTTTKTLTTSSCPLFCGQIGMLVCETPNLSLCGWWTRPPVREHRQDGLCRSRLCTPGAHRCPWQTGPSGESGQGCSLTLIALTSVCRALTPCSSFS